MHLEDILISDNLVPELDESVLLEIKTQVMDQYESDEQSMGAWKEKYDKALKLARMDSSKIQTLLESGARVMMPYILEAAIDFNARIVNEVLNRDEIVFGDIKGKTTEEKEARSERVTMYANYEVGRMRWSQVTDKEMMSLPIIGTTYKKTWHDDVKGRMCSGLVTADEVVFSQEVECFEDAAQVAHKLTYGRNYIASMKRAGLWEVDLEKLSEEQTDFEFCEIQFEFDLDEDGYAEPYIAIVSKDNEEIVRLVPNFDPEDIRYNLNGEILYIEKTQYLTQKQLLPDPEGGPMGVGFGILLHDIFETINTNIRQLTDAGTLANMASNSGLIAHGVQPRGNQASRYQTGEVKMELGVFKQVQVSGGSSLRDSVIQFPFAGPNPTLFQLLTHMEEAARRLTVAGQQVEANANEAASLYLARLQQALKFPNAMIWRVCEGLKAEFKCLFSLLTRYGDNAKYQQVVDDPSADLAADFNPDDCDIVPTLNPSQGSDWERLARAEAQLQAAMQSPQLHNLREAYLRYYEAMGVEDIESLLPEPDPNAVDPMQQMQMQYLAMEAEFRNREMTVKEQKLAIDQMKAVSEMREQVNKLRMEAEKADAERVETLTKAMVNLANIADMEEAKALRTIQSMAIGAASGRELSAGQPGRNTPMAGRPDNPNVPAMPGMVPGAATGRPQ